MGKKAVVVALTIVFLSSAGYALDPLGPPKALLNKGQCSPSVEYAYSEIDVEVEDGIPDTSSTIRASKTYANLRYGAWEDVDVFGRLGFVKFDDPVLHEGDSGVSFGLGAAATIRDTEKLDWGVVAQFSRGKSEAHDAPPFSTGESEIEAWSIQVAAGPTYQFRDEMAVYGGLFYHMFDGELDMDGAVSDFDLEEDDSLGIFAGLDWVLKENAHLGFELQYAGDTLGVTTGLRWYLQ